MEERAFTLEEIDEAFAELERLLASEYVDPKRVTCSIDSVAIDVLKILRKKTECHESDCEV